MAEPVFLQEHKIRGKPESDGKFSESPNKVHIGTTCSVCHKVPTQSRIYYGHLFCIDCFHKYIWSATKSGVTGFGDLKTQDESCDFELCDESTSK